MRTTLKQSFARVLALGCLAALCVTACTDHDTSAPQGTALLQLASVSVKGVEVAHTRAAAHTRANVTTEDNKGFTGIRKSSFAESDALSLALTTGSSTTTTVVATLGADNLWTLSKTYFTAGTALTATHTPALGTDMTYADVLTATVNPLPADGSKLTLELTHVNALIEVTPPAGLTVSDVRVHTTFAGTPEELKTATEVNAAGANVYRTIARPATLTDVATLTAVSLTMSNGLRYTAPVASTPQLDANKRYPVALTFKGDALTATVGTTSLDWGAGTDQDLEKNPPAGYDRYIATPEELAKFAKAVNDDVAGTGARIETVLQTADIDLSTLTTDPTAYDATAENWVPIGLGGNIFKGKYNGNGYTISNMKINATNTDNNSYIGLFAQINEANLMGIHLRDCQVDCTNISNARIGALVGNTDSSIITLCSASGTVTSKGGAYVQIAGLFGRMFGVDTSRSYVSRCNSKVNVELNSPYYGEAASFAAKSAYTDYAGCISSGTVTQTGNEGTFYGFCAAINGDVNLYHCVFTNPTPSIITSVFGTPNIINSCLVVGDCNTFGTFTKAGANVCTGTLGTTGSGFYSETTGFEAYNKLIGGNFSSGYDKLKTLHWSPKDGYTLDVWERTWNAGRTWKSNGSEMPTVNMSYEGDPPPIGGTGFAYELNGYHLTYPGIAKEQDYQWAATGNATEMANDPCKAAGNGWRLPTMKDFEVMLGWSANKPWSPDVTLGETMAPVYDSNQFKARFTTGTYWSSELHATQSDKVWVMTYDEATHRASYNIASKTNLTGMRVRCIQAMNP